MADAAKSDASPQPASVQAGESKRAKKKPTTGKKRKKKNGGGSRTRVARAYPASSFGDAVALADAIQRFASGERVRRLTLLGQLNKNPNSSGTRQLITNSSRYGLTTGSYAAEWLSLTELGRKATASEEAPRPKLEAQFQLAIKGIAPFAFLYEQYKGKKLPSQEVMKDALREANAKVGDEQECIDTFIVNAKYLGLLKTIAGVETLVSIDQVLDELGQSVPDREAEEPAALRRSALTVDASKGVSGSGRIQWSKVCFYISPIGDDGTEIRKHSDLFLGSLVEPALKDFGLEVVRADKISDPGMITSQVIEHIMRARLVIVDMSYHNPNVFYEMALRHACKLPIVQMTRKSDRLPFDINQMRTVVIDTSDIYTLVPRLETLRSEIATQVRTALNEGEATMTPISVFFPGLSVVLPKEK